MTFSAEGEELVVIGTEFLDGYGGVRTFSPEGKKIVSLGATADGEGTVPTMSSKGEPLVSLSATYGGHGGVSTYSTWGRKTASLSDTSEGNGVLWTYSYLGKPMVALTAKTLSDAQGYEVGVVNTYSYERKTLGEVGATVGGDGGVWTNTKAGVTKRLD